MTVAELIAYLQEQPQDLTVVYTMFSEQCVLEPGDMEIRECSTPREDGWVHDKRPDKPTQKYLCFPGN